MTTVLSVNGAIDIDLAGPLGLPTTAFHTPSDTEFGVQDLVDQFGMVFGGAGFGAIQSDGMPLGGTISTLKNYDTSAGEVQQDIWTFDIPLLVSDMRTWLSTDNFTALQNAVFGRNDTFAGSSLFTDFINAYGGDDTIFLQTGDSANGGDGNDTITLNGTNAFVVGGAGDDTLHVTSSSSVGVQDAWSGGEGTDTLQMNLAAGAPNSFIPLLNAAISGFERFSFTANTTDSIAVFNIAQVNNGLPLDAAFVGSAFRDQVVILLPTTGGAFSLAGTSFTTEGEWTTDGDGAFDVITLAPSAANANAYNLTAAPTGGQLVGSLGNDTLNGGVGRDILVGNGGVDVMHGNGGDDFLVMIGTTAPAQAQENFAAETWDGGDGLDSVAVNNVVDFIGAVHQVSALPEPTLQSMEGVQFNRIEAASTLAASAAFFAQLGAAPQITGSVFDNTLYIRSTGGALDLSLWTFQNWTAFNGSTGDRLFIQGIAGGDFLVGSSVSDLISGGAGGDYLAGGGDGDSLDGGDDFDVASWLEQASGVTLNLTNQAANAGGALGDTVVNIEAFYLTNFTDSFTANAAAFVYGFVGNDTITGSSASDIIDGGDGGDAIDAGAGFDYVSYYSSSAGVTLDLTTPGNNTGFAQGDTVTNGDAFILTAQNDTFVGLDAVQNIVFGYEGDDTFTGGFNTNNWFFGGAGNDRMVGGGVQDLFVLDFGADTIALRSAAPIAGSSVFNFNTGVDHIEISRTTFGQSAGYAITDGTTLVTGTAPAPSTAEGTFLYYTDSGLFYFDPDGTGGAAATLLAQFAGAPTISASDFILVS